MPNLEKFLSYLSTNNVKLEVVSSEKPSNNKFRYIANEELQKWPLLKLGELYMTDEASYIGNIPQRSDIEVGRYVQPGTFV